MCRRCIRVEKQRLSEISDPRRVEVYVAERQAVKLERHSSSPERQGERYVFRCLQIANDRSQGIRRSALRALKQSKLGESTRKDRASVRCNVAADTILTSGGSLTNERYARLIIVKVRAKTNRPGLQIQEAPLIT